MAIAKETEGRFDSWKSRKGRTGIGNSCTNFDKIKEENLIANTQVTNSTSMFDVTRLKKDHHPLISDPREIMPMLKIFPQ